MTLARLLRYFTAPIHRPVRRLEELLEDPHRVGYASLVILFLGCAYSVTVLIGYSKGFGAITAPWLAIPAEDYYLWEAFFTLPTFFLLMIVLSGVGRLLALMLKGSGSFESNFSVFAVATSLPMFALLWVPETTFIIFFADWRLEPLGGIGFIPVWLDALRQMLFAVWSVVIAVIGISTSERLTWTSSVVVVVGAFIPYAVLTLVFIR